MSWRITLLFEQLLHTSIAQGAVSLPPHNSWIFNCLVNGKHRKTHFPRHDSHISHYSSGWLPFSLMPSEGPPPNHNSPTLAVPISTSSPSPGNDYIKQRTNPHQTGLNHKWLPIQHIVPYVGHTICGQWEFINSMGLVCHFEVWE